jgi:glutamate 5-kinase
MMGTRDFSSCRRIVIKIGTNLLTDESGVDTRFISAIAHQVSELQKLGYQILIVSSGAIGLGAKELGISQRSPSITRRQAFASIGQPLLIYTYREAFKPFDLVVAQILLTRTILNNRKSFLNLRNSVEGLLTMGVIPIINENDSVSTDEIGTAFGDNDTLSALVASKIDADLLIMLTDIEGLYNGDPRKQPDVRLIHTVETIDSDVRTWASGAGSTFSTGGMKTKIQAAEIAARAGCSCVIASGTEPGILRQIVDGGEVGTLFVPEAPMNQRSRWILQTNPSGTITVDEGALRALRASKSLLPSGVTGVEGFFDKGSVVMINDVAKAVPSFNSREIEQLIGAHSSAIRDQIGPDRRDVIARPEDIVFLK